MSDSETAILVDDCLEKEEKKATDLLYEEEYRPYFLPLLMINPFWMPVFWKYHVHVSEKDLSFGYPYIEKKVNLSNVESAEKVNHINGLLQFGTWGVSKNIYWETGYIAKNGPGVRLVVKDENNGKKYGYVFNCDEPEKVCDLLNKKDNIAPIEMNLSAASA